MNVNLRCPICGGNKEVDFAYWSKNMNKKYCDNGHEKCIMYMSTNLSQVKIHNIWD